MDKIKRLGLYVIYVILCFATERVIQWLFPYTGLAGLICWPLTIFSSLALGFIIFKTTKRRLKSWQLSILFISVFTFQILFLLWTTPQDFGGTTFYKIGDAFKACKNYDMIKYNDFPNLTTGQRVAYIYKFKNVLPEKFTTLQIDSSGITYESLNLRTYIFEHRNEKLQYDSTQLKLINTDTSTVIIEYLNNSDTINHNTVHNIFNTKLMGWSANGYSFLKKEDNFGFKTGIEELLHILLNQTKNPNR